MTRRVIRIERVDPRDGVTEEPILGPKGYRLGDPKWGARKHHAAHAVFARTLDEAADLVAAAFSLWMVGPVKRASLVSPSGLRILR